jgi:hypothetical protein
MTKTSANIIADALDLLGRGPGVGQAVPVEDYKTMEGFIGPLYRQLSRKGVVTIGNYEDLPEEIYIPLTWLLANAAAPKYDMPQSADGQREQEQEIRRILAVQPTYETLRAEYF